MSASYLTDTLLLVLLASGWTADHWVLHRRLSGARRDPLSGLLTRAGWTTRALRAVRRTRSAVLLIDLDGFKAVNDRHGHQAGDRIIAETGARLTAWCGSGEVAGRLGGDEFAVAVAADGLEVRLTALRAQLARPVVHDGQLLRVGASIGVALLDDQPEPTLSAALHAADKAMYREKGRSRRGRRPLRAKVRALAAPLTRQMFGRAA
ncbi:GGDEF domain-containing protein [Streptomyces sp. NPDC059096]|uniref:GGDEF domain-containing protein n=1 Tax=Streptomyces sp. NPDC059096 TaxID=3346727 RepID=UPI00369716A8